MDLPIVPPETLEFERPSYRVAWLKPKDLVLRAPAEAVAEHGPHVVLRSSDPGVAVHAVAVDLTFSDSLEYYVGTVGIDARVVGARATLSATLGSVEATTHVYVTRREEGPPYQVVFDNNEMGIYRSVIEREDLPTGGQQVVVKVCTRHAGIRPFIGEHHEHQNTPVCRGIIAEVVADAAARQVVSELYRLRRGIEPFDADRLYREHYRRVQRFLPTFQRLLVGEPASVARGGVVPAALGILGSA